MNPLPIIIGLAAAFLLFTGSSNEESSKQLPEFSETSEMMPKYSKKSLTNTTEVRRNMYESETSPMNTEIKKIGGSLSETSETYKYNVEDEEEENVEDDYEEEDYASGGQRNYYSETDTSSFSRKLRKVFNE